MAMFLQGKATDNSLIFSDAQHLDNATSGIDSTNTVYFVGGRSGKMQINVACASSAFSIAQDSNFKIQVEYGTTSSPATSLRADIYDYTSLSGAATFTQGQLFCQYMIPSELAAAYDYCKLVYTTGADEGATNEKVDAWISIIT